MASPTVTRRAATQGRTDKQWQVKPAPGFRLYERRLRDASFFVVERRRGKVWMYASIAIAALLWGWLFLQSRH